MKPNPFFVFAVLFSLLLPFRAELRSCTAAIISPEASYENVPMLWKNRDTDYLSNKVVYIEEKPYSFIGLVNAAETSGRFVYAGLNSEGFAIINTVAYNLPKNEGEMEDLEGQVMSDALRTCISVHDFENYLKANLGETLGCWTNFGVIDASGNSALFEVHNNGYKRFEISDEKKKYLIVTNFARSGDEGEGEGYLRFEQATVLFDQIPAKMINAEHIFQNISRDLGNPLVRHPDLIELKNTSSEKPLWIYSRDSINRPLSSAGVIITGKKKGIAGSVATFWVILGEPVTSIAVPVWVESQCSPEPLNEGDTAPICAESMRLKKVIHPFSEGSKKNYLNVTGLVNSEGTGFLPVLKRAEMEIFRETAEFLKTAHNRNEYSEFQSRMAEKALRVIRSVIR